MRRLWQESWKLAEVGSRGHPEDPTKIRNAEATPNNRSAVWTLRQPSVGRRCHVGLSRLETRSQCPASKLQRTGRLELLEANIASDVKLKPVLTGHSRNPRGFSFGFFVCLFVFLFVFFFFFLLRKSALYLKNIAI